jgi:hypothetical protein
MEKADYFDPETLKGKLSSLLAGHGVDARPAGDWLGFTNRPGRIKALASICTDEPEFVVTQLDVGFSPWPGCLIWESSAGRGETRESSIRTALETFVGNTLHVLLKVFLGVDCHEQTNQYTIMNGDTQFTVTDGHFRVKSSAAVTADMMEWATGFRGLLENQPLTEGTHWVRLYYAQVDRQPAALELLLDNHPWESALPVARMLPWPAVDGFFGVRVFQVLQGGVDISPAIGLMATNPEADDKHLEELMVASGLSPLDASRLTLLIPIAFGNRLLERVGMTESTRCLIYAGHSFSEVDLLSSNLFRQARTFAQTHESDGTFSSDEFLALAASDPRVTTVSGLSESDRKNCKVTPRIICWSEPAPFVPLHSEGSVPAKRRPWWRLWKENLKYFT